MVFPSSMHANDSAAGIRRLYIEQNCLESCFSFENRRKLFEIDSRVKYATVVVQVGFPTVSIRCAFYLHDDAWLFEEDKGDRLLQYTAEFLKTTTGQSLNFLELRSQTSVETALKMYREKSALFGAIRDELKVFPTEELHTSKQRHRTKPLSTFFDKAFGDARLPNLLNTLINKHVLPVCKGEHFHQFDSQWGNSPDSATTISAMQGKEARLRAAQYYRFVIRQQASSTNERTVICNVSCPGLLYFHSALPERDPHLRPNANALLLTALCNSFSFDWIIRQLVAANVTFNFLDSVPVPVLADSRRFLVHASLRLHANHSGYEALWREQLHELHESQETAMTWPALSSAIDRLRVRATIDAVIAQAYGLSRHQYGHVLSAFSHSSYPESPELCLAAFDELHEIGLEAFTRRHDPYWDIPLNENLPQPVIDLPGVDGISNAERTESGEPTEEFELSNTPRKKRPKRTRQ